MAVSKNCVVCYLIFELYDFLQILDTSRLFPPLLISGRDCIELFFGVFFLECLAELINEDIWT